MFVSARKIIAAILLMLPFSLKAQEVENHSFRLLLNTMLKHDVPEIGAVSAHKDSSSIFLDAREAKEYAVSRIKGAEWVGYDDFDLKRIKNIPKDQPIIVYCSVGYRSEKVAKKLASAGYMHVKNLVGGIFEWKNRGFTVVDSFGKKTERVHAYNKVWGRWLKKGIKVYN